MNKVENEQVILNWAKRNRLNVQIGAVNELVNALNLPAEDVGVGRTSHNRQSASLSPCCKEFINSEFQYCPWCGTHVPGHYDARLS